VRGVLDTSVFIAREQDRPLLSDRLPDDVAVSVVTMAELELGVHMAASHTDRARRLATLRSLQSTYVALPVDETVASAFAALVAAARQAGSRPKVQDTWIAATAHVHSAAVYTQDSDFDGLPDIEVVRV
jgi:predicted nucleic acid-binding protein